jgi:hypothetical protein
MPITAFAARDFAVWDMVSGEVDDFPFDWARRMQYSANASATYGQTATGQSGSGWSAVGETAAGYAFWVPAGFTAIASASAQFWTAVLALTANGSSATSSALTGIQSYVRMSATGAPGTTGFISAQFRTSSGRILRDGFTARIPW